MQIKFVVRATIFLRIANFCRIKLIFFHKNKTKKRRFLFVIKSFV
ncbi:hypothetical protein SAMN05421780_102283 [Flexibacter flexilis DSM 6793]|uniref:Uncharacterized protein n=1 Tax=Flexibacter flexilis DSM 6793 TaxID=927664 RepID=A0A1I1FRJ7_9BACT|nr:hypothetical protein SAMN05421780_102283 [Flexibacter flexilis DSM 6793]